MKINTRTLPSLDSFVFFESAARHESFTRSAQELYITQAAVSKRIRELELKLGVQLFHRHGRTIQLTHSGRRLHQRITMALEYIEDACREVSDEFEQPVRIITNSAVSLFWLSPRLKEFSLNERSSHVNLITSDRASDHTNVDHDLAITYGFSETPGWVSEHLFDETLLPLASPEYFKSLGINTPKRFNDLENSASCITLLEYDRMAPDWINWRVWIDRSEFKGLKACKVKHCKSYAHAIGEAMKGKGLALGSSALLESELKAGLLVTVGRHKLQSGRGYYLIYPEKKKLSEGAQSLRNWLLEYK